MKFRLKRMGTTILCLILICLLAFTSCGITPEDEFANLIPSHQGKPADTKNPSIEYSTDAYNWTDLSVRSAEGKNGMVSSANAYASKAGLDILEKGGNAFDAAVAVAFALGVVEPYASGIGGGGVMTAYSAETDSYYFYNFREFNPAAGTAEKYTELGGTNALENGITAAGVPTEVAGLCAIVENLGSGNVTLSDILAPAIDYAENGFIIADTLATQIQDASFFQYKDKGSSKALEIFYQDGVDPLTTGDLLVQTDYANVLKEIARNGAAGFYTGWVAEAIVKAMEDYGGLITLDDLEYAMNNYPKITEPLHGTYKGYDIYTSTLPSSGGIILLETLNMLEYYQSSTGKTLEDIGLNSTEYIHLVSTAMELAYADKRHYVADNSISPITGEAFVDVPIEGLLSKDYAAQRFDACFDENQAFTLTSSYDYGGADRSKYSAYGYQNDKSPYEYQTSDTQTISITTEIDDNGTTSFSVADKYGNIVSFTQTINHFWGAYCIPDGCGFFLNNQLSSFSLNTSSVHYVEPFKQPVSHIMPTIIMRDGQPVATFGSPGSTRIPSAVIQVCLNLLDFGMSMQDAISNARMFSYCVSTNDGGYVADMSKRKKLLELEIGENCISPSVVAELEALGYYVVTYSGENLYFGGVHGILFRYTLSGKLSNIEGGADPRRDGKALGY